VADGLGRPPIPGAQEPQVPEGLPGAQGDPVGPEGGGQPGAGPGPVLAEQAPQAAGHGGPAGVVRLRAGPVGVQGGRPPSRVPLQDGPGGVRVDAQVIGDPGRGPPGVGQENDFQPGAGDGRQIRPAEGVEFGSGRVINAGANHETLYPTPAECLTE
jgi:hypothetical protein